MKKSLAFLMATSLVVAFLAPLNVGADSSDYDFEVTNVEIVPCVQDEDLDDERYDVNFSGGDREYVDFIYEKYLDGEFEEGGSREEYEMIEIADDESWYRYAEYDNSDYGTTIYRKVCVAIDFTAEGDFDALANNIGDSVPTNWEDFLAYVPQRFSISLVPVSSTAMPEGEYVPYYYTSSGGGSIEATYVDEESTIFYLNEENTIFSSISFRENSFNPEDSFDLIAAIDLDFSESRGLFDRTFFDGIRHYNESPRLAETDESNNVLYIEDFLEPWMESEHLAAPDVSITSSDDDSFLVEWDAVDGVAEYIVNHWKKHLSSGSEEWVAQEYQTDLSYDAVLATADNYIDCVNVVAVDENDIYGASSDDVCMGQFFSDVDEGLWYTNYTHNAVQNGMISGYLDGDGNLSGEFGPADTITTTQALKMVSILNGRFVDPDAFAFDLPYEISSDFESHWAWEYILSAFILDYDLVEDIDAFETDRDITRAEMISLIVEAMEVQVPSYTSYSLSDIEGHEYADEIELAYQLGIVSGYGETGAFGPDNSLLRAEAVKIFVESGNAFALTWPGYEF